MKPITELQVFCFGWRLFWHLHPEAIAPTIPDDPTWGTVRQIAEGDLTLARSPQEMSEVASPEKRPEVEAYLHRNIGKLIERDKEIAEALLAQMAEIK